MTCVIEDSDEEYLDDPIRLIDSEQKRIKVARACVQESIDLSDSDVDIVSLPPRKATELSQPPKPTRSVGKIVSSTLPVTFFEISRNIELLNKCLPLRIEIVDCKKHLCYYKRKYKNINLKNLVINENKKQFRNLAEGGVDVEKMKLKIRPVNVESYMKSPIRDIKTAMCRQKTHNLNKPALKASDKKKVQFRNIDFKKNQGLVGLKIVYNVNIGDSNPKIESTKQLNETKIPKYDSQIRKGESVEFNRSPKNPQTKLGIDPAPALVDTSNSEHTKIPLEEKNNQSNSESRKLQYTSKFEEGKMYKEKKSSQVQDVVKSKKDMIKNKCPGQKTKPKAFGKETKAAATSKSDQNKNSNIKKANNTALQENGMKVIHSEKEKEMKKASKSKPAISQTMEKVATSKNENSQKVNVEDNALVSMKTNNRIAKDSEKAYMLEKYKIPHTLQQDIIKHREQGHDKPPKSEKRTFEDQIPPSIARVSADISRQNIQKTSLIPPNEQVRSDINYSTMPSIMRPQNEKSFVLTDINDRKIDMFTSQMPGRCKNIGQSNPIPMLCSSSNNKNNMKTYADSKPKSQLVGYNDNTDNKMENNSFHNKIHTALTSKATNSQSNVKSLPKIPASNKQKKSELQQKQGLSNQQFNVGRSEHLPNKQAPVPNKKVVLYPVSHYSALAENNRTTTSQAAQEKRSMCNETPATSHNLSTRTLTIPSSIHQMLPTLDPRKVRYQVISQIESLPKEIPSSVSQSLLPKKIVSTPPAPPNTKTQSNILSNARIIIKRPNPELNSKTGQQLAEKQYGDGNGLPNNNFSLIPTLTSTQKGRYVIVNKKFMNKNILVREQHTSGPYNQELLQQLTMSKQNNTEVQNQKSSQYSVPGLSGHNNQMASKEYFNKKPVWNPPTLPKQQPNSYPQNQLIKRNSTQKLNLQPEQPSDSAHNQTQNALQDPFPHPPPQPNPHLPYYLQNEHAQYYNDKPQLSTNQVPVLNQQPKQNEYGSYYNSNTMLNIEQAPLPTQPKPNEYESYYNHTAFFNTYQASVHYQQKPNANGPSPIQNTILNLDTNTLMQSPPQDDYASQNMNNMDCAYWNDVNYLGDDWQQGYPHHNRPPLPSYSQHTQPPPPSYPEYLPPPAEYQHPLPFPYLQHQPPPPTMQHPHPTPVPQHTQPSLVSENPPPPAATHYLQPSLPPPAPQHQTPPLPQPSSFLPVTATQGSTILGANNNGVVRTINLVTSTVTAPNVATSNNSLTNENNIPVNTKSEMLQELCKSMVVESPNLKRPISDSHKELSKYPNGKPLPGPLAKVRKMEGLATDPSLTQKALNNGYSPPILPIPTYEKTFEYIAQVSGFTEETSNNIIDAIVSNDKQIEGILKKKSDDGCADGDKVEKSAKKISIDEYKNRATNNNKPDEKVDDVGKTELTTESKFDENDLGYDSDSTVIL